MKFVSTPIIAALISTSQADAWSSGMMPRRGSFVEVVGGPLCDGPFERMIRDRGSFVQENPFFDRTMFPKDWTGLKKARNSIQYEILSTDKEMKVVLDVPGIKASDITVTLEDNDKVLKISGTRETKGDGYNFSASFTEKFYVTSKIDLNKLSAQLQDGVLTISAPKVEREIRKIPIVTTPVEGPETYGNTAETIEIKKNDNGDENGDNPML